jgi:uncharacterized protein (TIRG00374 family)
MKNQDLKALYQSIRSVHYIWYIPVLISTLLCHYFRTKRWQLLLEVQSYKLPTLNVYNALMSAYIVNFVTGKLGEFYRCGVLLKKNEVPFSFSFATVLIERIIDVLSLLFLFIISIFLFQKSVFQFIQTFVTPLFDKLLSHSNYLILLVVLMSLGAICLMFFRKSILQFLQTKLKDFSTGLISIIHLKEKKWFLLYTVLIWMMYLCMTYFWFFAFTDKHLNIQTALLVIILGGIGRSLPIPAHGLGAYHICASFALTACLVQATESLSIPIVIHAGQTLFYTIFGSLSMVYIGFNSMSLKNEN